MRWIVFVRGYMYRKKRMMILMYWRMRIGICHLRLNRQEKILAVGRESFIGAAHLCFKGGEFGQKRKEEEERDRCT